MLCKMYYFVCMKNDVLEKCPICKGAGKIKQASMVGKQLRQKKNIAKLLKKEGYSLREIMRLMNYKAVGSVQNLLKK